MKRSTETMDHEHHGIMPKVSMEPMCVIVARRQRNSFRNSFSDGLRWKAPKKVDLFHISVTAKVLKILPSRIYKAKKRENENEWNWKNEKKRGQKPGSIWPPRLKASEDLLCLRLDFLREQQQVLVITSPPPLLFWWFTRVLFARLSVNKSATRDVIPQKETAFVPPLKHRWVNSNRCFWVFLAQIWSEIKSNERTKSSFFCFRSLSGSAKHRAANG